MKIGKEELENRLLEGVRNGTITLLEAHEERMKFKKENNQSNLEPFEEDKYLKTIPTQENHQIKPHYKWAVEQVEELKPFGNFYRTYFDDKTTS